MIFYSGPSVLDGKPIVAIATPSSKNRKTGDMVQTWILRRDIDPVQALMTGKDASVCGNCYHRGSDDRPRTCYVNVGQAPLSVWRSYKRGLYKRGRLGATDKPIRMGAYGDPVAVPWHAWDGVLNAKRLTGYTHQWRELAAWPFRNVLMASVDSVAEAAEAAAAGWRTFLAHSIDGPEPDDGIQCPSGFGSECVDCGLCAGLQKPNAPSIWIRSHGPAARFVGV